MPYSPGVSYNPGFLAQGISALGQGLADGIVAKQRKDEEKQKKAELKAEEDRKRTAARAYARKIAPSVGLGEVDDAGLDAGIDAMGIDNFLGMSQRIQQAEEQRKAAALQADLTRQAIAAQKQQMEQQAEAEKRRIAAEDRNRAALRGATDPNAGLADQIAGGASFDQLDPNAASDPATGFMRRGGDDPQLIGQLNAMAAASAKRGAKPRPELMEIGGVKGVWDGNNFSQIRDPKAEKPAAQTATIGGKEYTDFGGKVFDANGELVAPDKPLDPITGEMLMNRYKATIARIQKPKKSFSRKGKLQDEQDLMADQEQANFQASQLGLQIPFPRVGMAPSADPDEPSGKPATKKTVRRQKDANGNVHEYELKDGQWVFVR